MEKSKILFILPQLDVGGSERVVFQLAQSLNPVRFEVFVAAFRGGVLVEPLRSLCREVFIIEKKPGLDLSAMANLSNIIKNHRIGIVNAHHYMPCFYSFLGTKLLNGKRLIYTEHSVPEVERIVNCFHRRIMNLMLYRIDAVIGVSGAITEKFKNTYPQHSKRFSKVINGVDIEKFAIKSSRERVRKKWGLNRDNFVVGTVANFRKIKNHLCLVRAACRLKESHPHLRLLFVGRGFDGDLENSEHVVRDLIREQGLQDRVIIAGYQENIPEILSSLDAFCLPSFSEGLPVSLLESMAAGVIVIGSDVMGISEVVEHEKTGLLFPSNDDYKLAMILCNLMDNHEASKYLARAGFDYVTKCHSVNSWVMKYENILSDYEMAGKRVNRIQDRI